MNRAKLWSPGRFVAIILFLFSITSARAGEADVKIPDLSQVQFQIFGSQVSGVTLLYAGLVICILGMLFGWMQYRQTKALEVHSSMRAVSNIIWETCKTYMIQQGKFLSALWVLIAACIAYYFLGLQHNSIGHV